MAEEIRDLDDASLASRALNRANSLDEEEVLSARMEVIRRCEFQMVKYATTHCRQMGNRGIECLGLSCPCSRFGCHGVLEAALEEFAYLITKAEVRVSQFRSTDGLFQASAPTKPRSDSRNSCTLSRWSDRSSSKEQVGLVGFVVGELRLSGRTMDVRRRWNLNRGLKARCNVPVRVLEVAESIWKERPQLMGRLSKIETKVSRRMVLEAQAEPKRLIKELANWLYDDACETANSANSLVDVERLARRFEIQPSEPSAESILEEFLEEFDSILAEASERTGSSFYVDHFHTSRSVRSSSPCLGRS